MYLKKLELVGFKSFSDPTSVTLQSGITSIVGPNGCGKSNIVDALLWVLGEQSTKTLRSDKMEDVIFNGSESRKPINMAEVTLTVSGVTSQEVLNRWGEFHELSICRRLFRTGESDYLINRIPCRLKDIREVLIDTGAGHKGHTIIEQGKVDQLLNTSATERRGLIEDTAGIGKYKIRKAEAERKLEATHQNLLRVRDIISEVKRQIQGLDRQVRRTEAYNAHREEAMRLEQGLLVDDYRNHQRDLQSVEGRIGEVQTAESALLAQLGTIDARIQESRSELAEKERALTEIRQKTYDLQTQIHQKESRIELLRSQMAGWEDQRRHFTEEQERLSQARERCVTDLERVVAQQQETRESLERLRQTLETREAAHRDLEERIAGREAELERDKTRIFELLGLIAEDKNQVAALESRSSEIVRAQEKSRSDLSAVDEQIRGKEDARNREQELLTEQERRIGEIRGRQAHAAETILERRNGLAELDRNLISHREDLTRLEAQLASLREQEESLLSAQMSLREHLRTEADLMDRFSGIVADGFSVEGIYERAIEAVLGDRLQALIAEDHAAIENAISKLKTSGSARSVFIPKTPRMKPGVHGLSARDGVVGPALAFVTPRPGFENLVQALLGGAVIVRDLKTGLEIWREQPLSEILVTLDGEVVFPSGMVTGGQSPDNQKGFLQVRRRRAEMESALDGLRNGLSESETRRAGEAGELERLTAEQDSLLESLHRAEIETTAQREKVNAIEGERERLMETRSLLEAEDRQRADEIREISDSLRTFREKIGELEGEHGRIQERMSSGQESLSNWDDERRALSSELTQLKVDLTSLTERNEVLFREDQRLGHERDGLEERLAQRKNEADGLADRIQTAKRDSAVTEAEIASLAQGLSGVQSELSAKSEQVADHLSQLRAMEEDQSRTRGEAGRIEHQLKELQIREAELKLKLETLTERLQTGHSTTPEEAAGRFEAEPIEREAAVSRLAELRIKMEQMGPVNLAAPEEYRELEERYQFLTGQEQDLSRSVEDLQKAIQKINRTARELFLSAYQSLRVKFREVFCDFFQGGQADLILEDESNPLESGIEIVAQPPGKRLRHISLLSGGEKALTAISLLFASFLIHPTPFCVLDEIDAPLDEENTRRFLRALRQMTGHSQFIVITHNKRTMEQADILYGVTMEEAGVSKLVSVRLESGGNGSSGNHAHVETVGSPTATA
jgi:chromosome segregation protein